MSDAAFVIRDATADDATAITGIARRAKSAWGYPPDWLAAWRSALTVDPDYLRQHRAWVALRAGVVVGACVLEANGRCGALEHMWVAPECQRQGIGRALVSAALADARRHAMREVRVESDPFAEPFYLRLGARPAGERPAPMPGAPDRVLPVLTFRLDDNAST